MTGDRVIRKAPWRSDWFVTRDAVKRNLARLLSVGRSPR
jgi:hypothetical protein